MAIFTSLVRRPFLKLYIIFSAALLLHLYAPALVHAQGARRVVVIKVDGLPNDMVDRFVRERNPRTGKSQLPWINRIFYEEGTRLANFYVRGMSLSGPSWSLLDTGQHLQIKGNVEYDRYTLHSYDYLNFIPFYVANIAARRIDMPGVEVLDELGVPLLVDAYPYDERYNSFQLYQRGNRWTTISRSLSNRFKRSPRELLDEWAMGLETRNILFDQFERELIQKLSDPRVRYLDYYTTEFDHTAHHNRDREAHLAALQELDAIIGRIWTAVEKSPEADATAFVLVSDHGVNTDERVYSQGYNLVKLLGSAQGGGHHVVTKRRLMLDYSIKGIYPLVPLITTTTPDSFYLKGQSTAYPTALLDFDGNERASLHLRDSDLNVLHILLQQLQRRDTPAPLRHALTLAFFQKLDARRAQWSAQLAELNEELGALRRAILKQSAIVAAQPKKWTKQDQDAGRDKEAIRQFARMDSAMGDERQYTLYAATLSRLLALKPEGFDPFAFKIENVIEKGAMGQPNSVQELQNYVVGVAPGGFRLRSDGALDMQNSFTRVNYFSLLHAVSMRNNVQPLVDSRPVDFTATRISCEHLAAALGRDCGLAGEAIWLYGGPDRQALLLARAGERGDLSFRYLPISNLRQNEDGSISFERVEWRSGFPLKYFEDEQFGVAAEARAAWLNEWHTELEWLRATHRTKYSNALIGLHEQLARHPTEQLSTDEPALSTDELLLRRFRKRQRMLAEADMLVMANDHWNFDVRGFNPGGNHGSFFRISTHSTLMMAGGSLTGIPRGRVVEEPYDSLSFVPTLLALTGQLHDGRVPVPVLWKRGFRSFPGRLIQEVLGGREEEPIRNPVAKGAEAP
ncbi:MAG TPA: alkaline phosphatase family protein [Pyrinomonadaceae bacterium]|nr:alkaline phosphatase family protein [Pyrinomonadaceae bacterium]